MQCVLGRDASKLLYLGRESRQGEEERKIKREDERVRKDEMRVQENKERDGYREAQNWDADVLDTPEDDDVEVCACVAQDLPTLQGPNPPQKESKI